MICDICGKKGAKISRITETYERGRNLLIITGIPVITCPHCGERYLTATTLHRIDRIKLHRKVGITKRTVTKKDETGYYVTEVPAMPGCFSQGKTLVEVKKNIKEAIAGWTGVMYKKKPKAYGICEVRV